METQFAPGPWETRVNGVFLRIVHGSHKTTVADSVVSEANARLIAAAPELLEALKAAQSQLDKAADQFAFYADEHAKKRTKEGDEKGAVNHQWALACARVANNAFDAIAKSTGADT